MGNRIAKITKVTTARHPIGCVLFRRNDDRDPAAIEEGAYMLCRLITASRSEIATLTL